MHAPTSRAGADMSDRPTYPMGTAPTRGLARCAAAVRALALALPLACAAGPAAAAPAAARPKVCLVLSGGGARGIPHIGVLQVLEELRVPVDCVVGTSAGAIIGGAYASGASPAEIERAIRGADWDYLLSDQPERAKRSPYTKETERAEVGGAEVGLRGTSIELQRGALIGQHLQFFLQALVSPARNGSFDRLPIPYRALATDFESGKLVVLDHGDLAAAIRASMSVPGAFAPVELDGRLLVDGGLMRNLGVDVARALGADVVIAVNVGTPLLGRAQLGSILSAAEQTLAILTEQNVSASIATLTPRDVLITPELGDLGSADFAHGADHIAAGAAATRAVADALAPLAVSEEEYARWQGAHRLARVTPHYDRVVVDTGALKRVPPASIERLVGAHPDPAQPETVIDRLLATDDFERVDGTLRHDPDGNTLVLRPVEKPWGPDYLRMGATLSAGTDGLSTFTLRIDQRDTWLSDRGLEWRNRLSLGQVDALSSELRLPFDSVRALFFAPYVRADDQLRYLFVGDDAIETYRQRSVELGTDLGVRLGTLGEFTAGIGAGAVGTNRTIGSPLLPDDSARVSTVHAHWLLDDLDNLDFPRSGWLLDAQTQLARPLFGAAGHFDRLSVELERAFGWERSSLLLAVREQTALGSDLPFYELFSLGGFQNLSGMQPDQLEAARATFGRAVFRREVAAFSPLLPAVYAGLSLEYASLGARPARIPAGSVFAGSVFLSASSAAGPLYLGLGVAEGGFVSVYLLVGRP
jgi:NTE family protein